ncbi:MAG: carbohydrate ABC transporter substrate-binding protein [Phycisphaerales bacterium]|nr:carbohydrate ABC transporter substrate-binding protein [Phycisphaerales bacterium]
MKYLFIACLVVLTGASVLTALWLPESRSSLPVLYWVTDPNPARQDQINIFKQWLKKNGYPDMELRVDSANNDQSKKIIQGVSGVAGDIWDLYSNGETQYYYEIGLLRDVTEPALRMGFDPSHTWKAGEPELMATTHDGQLRQFAFPCNATVGLFLVNRQTFRDHQQPLPPKEWKVDEFERLGREYVRAANKGLPSRRYFYADGVNLLTWMRSCGVGEYNETLTRCTMDDPRFARLLERWKNWMEVDHIIPSNADLAAMTASGGYGGTSPQKFNSGEYAMIHAGRYLLIQMRQFDADRKKKGLPLLDMTTAGLPYDEFANVTFVTRSAAVYVGSKHPELAYYFLSYLASEDYNMQIVRDADSLPPNPAYTRTEAYLHPPDHPNEWDVHGAFAKAAETIAIGNSYSPFVLRQIYNRELDEATQEFLTDRISADQAVRQLASRLNQAIDRTLVENPELKPLYDKLVKDQQTIDSLRARGEKVPLSLIRDPFHRAYYQYKGWAQ